MLTRCVEEPCKTYSNELHHAYRAIHRNDVTASGRCCLLACTRCCAHTLIWMEADVAQDLHCRAAKHQALAIPDGPLPIQVANSQQANGRGGPAAYGSAGSGSHNIGSCVRFEPRPQPQTGKRICVRSALRKSYILAYLTAWRPSKSFTAADHRPPGGSSHVWRRRA